MSSEISISTPKTFNFHRTVISHGWCELLPFALDRDTWELTRVLGLGQRPSVTVRITATKRELQIKTSRKLSKAEGLQVERDVRHIMRLDDDLSAFYTTMTANPDFEWI